MVDPREFVAGEDDAGSRVDRFLVARLTGFSRTRIQALIREGSVLIDGQAVRPAEHIVPVVRVTFRIPSPPSPIPGVAPAPEIELAVIYADDAIVVVNKPTGQVVHPAAGHQRDTLVNALVARYPDLARDASDERPGLVHRLDRDTSGVIVVARTAAAGDELRRQFKHRSVEKVYLALVKGAVSPPQGLIDAPVGRDPIHRQRMAALPRGRAARTAYRTIESRAGYTWLEVRPQTGRTHQIRVHLAAVGQPVAGDAVYGRRDRHVGRLALHAWQLGFDHPVTGERSSFSAPVPDDLAQALADLGFRSLQSIR